MWQGKAGTLAVAALLECLGRSATPAMELIRRRCRPALSKTRAHDPKAPRPSARRSARLRQGRAAPIFAEFKHIKPKSKSLVILGPQGSRLFRADPAQEFS
jgi:hypothetical protein